VAPSPRATEFLASTARQAEVEAAGRLPAAGSGGAGCSAGAPVANGGGREGCGGGEGGGGEKEERRKVVVLDVEAKEGGGGRRGSGRRRGGRPHIVEVSASIKGGRGGQGRTPTRPAGAAPLHKQEREGREACPARTEHAFTASVARPSLRQLQGQPQVHRRGGSPAPGLPRRGRVCSPEASTRGFPRAGALLPSRKQPGTPLPLNMVLPPPLRQLPHCAGQQRVGLCPGKGDRGYPAKGRAQGGQLSELKSQVQDKIRREQNEDWRSQPVKAPRPGLARS